MVFSTSKGMSGLAVALAQSRGLLDYDEHVSRYWPEFAQQGKEKITVRQLLSHQAGLFAVNFRLTKEILSDFDRLATVLAQEKPAWEPGSRQAYHAVTLGFYESELIRRVDPQQRSVGQFFQDEIATPLGLDFYLRLPDNIPDSKLATLKMASPTTMMFSLPFALALSMMNPRSVFRRAFGPIGDMRQFIPDGKHPYPRNLEIPSGTGVGTARALALAYSTFATGGKELGIREETLEQLMAAAIPPSHGFHDECLKIDCMLSLGFLKPKGANLFGDPSSFGTPGSGGSFGFADPKNKIGYAYVLNRMGPGLHDPRDVVLRTAMYKSIGKSDPYRS